MKNISKQRKTRKVRENALKQLRETRAMLQKEHPQLFEKIRKIVAGANKAQTADTPSASIKPEDQAPDEAVTIDRKKNLEAILKYAALKPGSEKLKRELKDFLN